MKFEVSDLCYSCRNLPWFSSGLTIEEALVVLYHIRENDKEAYEKSWSDERLHERLFMCLVDGGHCSRCVDRLTVVKNEAVCLLDGKNNSLGGL